MNKSTRDALKWLGLALGLIGILLVMMFAAMPGDGGSDNSEVLEDEWIKGTPGADIVIVEYSDFQCPACAARLSVVEPVISEFDNHIQFIYRHYPLRSVHPNAQLAAQAAEAAGIQGEFWEMHDMLFARQDDWSNLSRSQAEETFTMYASSLGLDDEQFANDLTSKAVENAVNDDYKAGVAAGVNSTPSFFLNGESFNFNSNARTAIREVLDAQQSE